MFVADTFELLGFASERKAMHLDSTVIYIYLLISFRGRVLVSVIHLFRCIFLYLKEKVKA